MPLVMPFYVGTYAQPDDPGIFLCELDVDAAALRRTDVTASVPNPSFLAIHPGGQVLYAVNEAAEFRGEPGGGVSAFKLDSESGALSLTARERTHGAHPCHVTVDPRGSMLLVANYSGGSAAVFPLDAAGSLRPPTQVVQHKGAGPHPKRQTAPHVHSVTLTPDGRLALVADLGLDRVAVYRLDREACALRAHTHPYAATHAGAGPRHLVFHPSGTCLYVINELDSSISVMGYDVGAGAMSARDIVSTLPEGWQGNNSCADIHASSDGRFVYGSNRGHDSIAVYAVDQDDGRLELVQHCSTRGESPRNFALDPTGAFAVVANQKSGNLVLFRRDAETGTLAPTGSELAIPKPVCVCFRCDGAARL